MNRFLYSFACLLIHCSLSAQITSPINNPGVIRNSKNIHADTITLADPTIFYHEGTYYLYGTGAPNGFMVYSSTDLKHWQGPVGKQNGYALHKMDSYGTEGFWAPQVFQHGNKFYMAYTANENIAIATSTHPLGPFKQDKKQALNGNTKQIDPFVFFDNGKAYLYYVRLTEGNRIFVATLTDDFRQIKEETIIPCIDAVEPWENTEQSNWPVAEGPTVFKHKELYYLVYSANDFRNPDYAIGYATATQPTGPWKKHPGNPIISRKYFDVNGTGHGDLFRDKSGQLQYVLHTHYSQDKVSPRKTALVKLKFVKEGEEEVLRLVSKDLEFLVR